MAAVALKDVTKVFPDGTVAVDNLSLDVGDGELVVLLGPAGCGKSTVLRMVAGRDDPSSGAILLDGELINRLPPRDRGVATVFVDVAPKPRPSVADSIPFAPRLAGGQRVAVGGAALRRPRLLLMDEPLSNLDRGRRAELRAELSGLVRELGVSTIYATHDQAEALTMADRVAVLRKGVLHDLGTPTQVYGRPATLYVAAFLGSTRMNLLEASVHVYLDRHIALTLGEQVLRLPWHDLRARAVAPYHGERIVLGVRAEALTPVAPDASGDVLRGRIRYLEHQGHESLAFLDIGATALVVEEFGGSASDPALGSGPLRRFGDAVQRIARRAPDRVRVGVAAGHVVAGHPGGSRMSLLTDPGGQQHRRPAELAVRLAPNPAVAAGHQLAVSVRMAALHFFDGRGDRIDAGWR